ncbi:MAG: hypothetical protein Kow0075_04650 [Salibacteraceae bacterium]
MKIHRIILTINTALILSLYGRAQPQTNQKIEEKALHILLNNLQELPLSNIKFYGQSKEGKIFYRYVNMDSARVASILQGNPWSTRYKILQDTNMTSQSGEISNFSVKDEINPKIQKKLLNLTEDSTAPQNNDLKLFVLNSIEIANNRYVFIDVQAEGSIVISKVLLKFDDKGNLQRMVCSQGEE